MRAVTDPIERTVRYATTVPSLADAWVFVMTWIDELGTSPKVTISPYWTVAADSDETPRRFEVVVEGMQEVTGA